jgi:hypothetical protein
MNIERFVSNGPAKKVLFYLLAALVGGCVPILSLHSLYTEEDVVFEEKLLGTWLEDPNKPESTWKFKRIEEPNNAYNLVLSDEEGKKGSFVAHLVKLEDSLFLDVFPDEFPCDTDDPNKTDWLYNVFFLVPAHTFLKIEQIEPTLKMRIMEPDNVEEMLENDPNLIKHEIVQDRPVLTASTKELQKFMKAHANDEGLFGEPSKMKRVQPKDPNAPQSTKSQQ